MLNKQGVISTSLKIIIPLWLTFFLFAFSIFFVFVPSLKTNMMDQKKEMIQKLTDSAVSLLSEYVQRIESGELTVEDAQSRAISRVRSLRYGSEGKDYFWINDMEPKMVMHPYFPNLEGKNVSDFVDPKGKHLFLEFINIVQKNGSGYVNYLWQWKDDSKKIVPKISYVKGFKPWGWVVGTGIYIEEVNSDIKAIFNNLFKIFFGVLIFILGLSVYITLQTIKIKKRKNHIEQALKKEKETLLTVLERTPHGIALIDNKGKYLYVNPYFTKITGYLLKDIRTKKEWFEKAYPDKEYRKKVTETWDVDVLSKNSEETREFKIKCKDGQSKQIEFRSTFLKDQKISVLTDVTIRKQSEEMIREKDRLQGVLELSGAVCHEMNQPLMAISGYSELILMDISEDNPAYSTIVKIQKQIDRLSNITRKLMEISRYETKDYLKEKIVDLAKASNTEKL